MKRIRLFSVVALANFAWLAADFLQPAAAQSYLVVDLGTPDNSGSYSAAHGMNQSGAVVGEWEPTNSIWQQAFFYRDGTNGDLGGLNVGGGVYAIAHAVNSSNQITGESGIAAIHAFLYTNGAMTDLGTLGGGYSTAWAINSAGHVVGESTISFVPNPPDHAVWYHGGAKTDLGTLPGGNYSSAKGINDSGVIGS